MVNQSQTGGLQMGSNKFVQARKHLIPDPTVFTRPNDILQVFKTCTIKRQGLLLSSPLYSTIHKYTLLYSTTIQLFLSMSSIFLFICYTMISFKIHFQTLTQFTFFLSREVFKGHFTPQLLIQLARLQSSFMRSHDQ